MGRLYAGRHSRLGMDVAIKVTLETRGTRPETIERAEREAKAMADIVSPYVARVIDLVRTPDGRPCIVTELLHGRDLSTRLERDGKLSVEEGPASRAPSRSASPPRTPRASSTATSSRRTSSSRRRAR
ncbi:MAG: protein kinase [Sandaracinaceae bacterium]|nr:protein kinase [Sandaracinaceae bacterium]